MLLLTAFCLCSQRAHAISGRSSSQPFRGTSHKSSISSRSSFFVFFTWSLITPVEATQYYLNHHYFTFYGSFEINYSSGFQPSETLITPIYFDASSPSTEKPTKIDTLFFCFSSPGAPKRNERAGETAEKQRDGAFGYWEMACWLEVDL